MSDFQEDLANKIEQSAYGSLNDNKRKDNWWYSLGKSQFIWTSSRTVSMSRYKSVCKKERPMIESPQKISQSVVSISNHQQQDPQNTGMYRTVMTLHVCTAKEITFLLEFECENPLDWMRLLADSFAVTSMRSRVKWCKKRETESASAWATPSIFESYQLGSSANQFNPALQNNSVV